MSQAPPVTESAVLDSPDGADHVGSRFRLAVGWSFVMNGGREAMTVAVTFVLAAILGPEAYGVVALALAYVLLLQLLLQSIIPAVIHRAELSDADKDTVFWLAVSMGIVLTLVGLALSSWWAAVTGIPQLRTVVPALSVLVIVKSLVVVQEALLKRELDFRPLAIRTNTAVFVGGFVGLVMAVTGFGVWALVGQQLVTGVVELAVLWGVSTWRPRLRFSMATAREVLGFAGMNAVSGLGVFATTRSDALLMGLFFGPAAIGLYRIATRAVDAVVRLLTVSLQSVALPELARHQDEPSAFTKRLGRIVRLSAMLSLPALGVLVAIAGPLTDLLGEDWAPAAPAIQVLCVVGAVRATSAFSGPMLQALGRPQHQALLAWLVGGLSAAVFVLVGIVLRSAPTQDQILWMAVSRSVLFGGVFLALNVVLLVRVGGLALKELGSITLPSALAGGLAALIGLIAASQLPSPWSPLLRLALTLTVGVIVAGATLYLVEPAARQVVRTTLSRAGKSGSSQPLVGSLADGNAQ